MSEPIEYLDYLYFDWLCSKVGHRATEYNLLLDKLRGYEFVWVIPGDDNRAEDCYDLRLAFFRDNWLKVNRELLEDTRRSVLEVLVAFAERASFETNMPPDEWFWIMMTNLNLIHFPDALYSDIAEEEIDAVLHTFIWRLYDANGHGGLFPLDHSLHDQRKVEIWYQFSEYLVANNYI